MIGKKIFFFSNNIKLTLSKIDILNKSNYMFLATKNFIAFILLSTLSIQAFSQETAYYPNGTKILIKYNSYKELLHSLKADNAELHIHKLGLVYFKKLSNIPVVISFEGKGNPTKIKEMINSYNYTKYINSYSYYFDLKNMMNEGLLSKNYLNEIFKEPDTKEFNEDSSECWIFKKFNFKVVFKDNKAQSIDVINYKAIDNSKLAILLFKVTGNKNTVGFNISLSNHNSKTIKYSFITVTATNSVDDKVGTKIVKAVGPIKSNETGEYEFEDVIYSNDAEYLTIDSIKLEYMDGTINIISKAQIEKISITDWEEYGKTI